MRRKAGQRMMSAACLVRSAARGGAVGTGAASATILRHGAGKRRKRKKRKRKRRRRRRGDEAEDAASMKEWRSSKRNRLFGS